MATTNSAFSSSRTLQDLCQPANYLQNANVNVDHRVDEIFAKVKEIEEKVEGIDRREGANSEYIQTRFEAVRGEIATVKDTAKKETKASKRDVYCRFDKLHQRFDEIDRRLDGIDRRIDVTNALARNRLCTRLSSSIYRIYALVRDKNGRSSYEVHPDFPVTVRDFWHLKGKTLRQLAKHYLPSGWKSWARDDPDHSDATDFDDIEFAVAAHPTTCLRTLAENWGLDYEHLERPRRGEKRKVEHNAESRQRKVRKVREDYTEISLRIGQDPKKVSEPDVMTDTSMTLPDMLRECRVPEQPQLSPGSGNVEWSTSSMDTARHQIHSATGPDTPIIT